MNTTHATDNRRPIRTLPAAALACLALAGPAAAQCDPDWVQTPGFGFAGVNGSVHASTMWDPDGDGPEPEWLVIGGMFSAAGDIAAGALAAYDGAQWRSLEGGVTEGRIFDRVSALAVYKGMLIVGGHFGQAGPTPVQNIAAYDGAQWHALGQGVYGGFAEPEVMALAIYEGNLVAAGAFTDAGDGRANFVASWDGNDWTGLGTGVDFAALALATHDGELFIGGQFNSAGGVPNTERLARWDGSAWSSVGGGVSNGIVQSLASIDGSLYVGGQFGVIGGLVTPGIARWDGSQFQPLGQGVPGIVMSVQTFDGQLHAGGLFSVAGGAAANNIARFDGSNWQPLAQGVDDVVFTMTETGADLFVGGRFREAGTHTALGMASWDGSVWSSSEGRPLEVVPGGLAVFEDDLIISGYADLAAGNRSGAVVRFDGLEFTPMGGAFNELPWDVAVHGGDLYAVGWFTEVGGTPAAGVARWNGAAWQDIGADLAGGSVTSALSVGSYEGDLVTGGDFTSAGGVPANHIARYDGTDWHPLGQGLGDDYSFVWDLVEFNGDLIAAGLFPTNTGSTPKNVARWDGTQWHDLGSGLSGGSLPDALAVVVFEGDLIVAGNFTNAGGTPTLNIARWDGTQWHAMGDGAPPNGVRDLVVYNGSLYAGAQFFFSDDPTQRFVKWDGTAWQPISAGLNGGVGQFQPYQNELVLSGNFSTAGGDAAPGLARWSDTQAPWFAAQPEPVDACLGDDTEFAAAVALGYEAAALQWYRDGVPLTDGPTGYGSVVSGATTGNLMIADAHAADAGQYELAADNGCGVSRSQPAALSLCIADFDCSGAVNSLDVLAYLNAWAAGDTLADIDGDGQTNTADVLAFLNAWTAGC